MRTILVERSGEVGTEDDTVFLDAAGIKSGMERSKGGLLVGVKGSGWTTWSLLS